MASNTALIAQFVALSSELCGLSEYTLRGTGFSVGYYSTVVGVVGQGTMGRLLKMYIGLPDGDPAARVRVLRTDILSDPELGPVARNIIKLWYVSIWFELPLSWTKIYGTLANDQTFIPLTYAYPEGLLGPAIGAHVQGAKAPGYGSWAEPPQPLEFEGDPRF